MATEGHDEDVLELMRAAAAETPLHKLLDLRPIRLDTEGVTLEMPVAEGALNLTGNLHGGAIATLIDVTAGTAAAVCSTTFEPGVNTIVTADMHVRYLARARGDYVRAHARVLRSGRSLVVVECTVRDEDGRVIAVADFASMVVPLRQALRTGDARNPDL